MQTQFTLYLEEFIQCDYFVALFEKGAVNFINDDKSLLDNSYEIALCGLTASEKTDEIIESCIKHKIITTSDLDAFIHENYAILEDDSDKTDYLAEQERQYFNDCVRNSSTGVSYA